MFKIGSFMFLIFHLFPLQLLSCPLCHSSTAEEVRAGLITTSLDGITIPALILPFVVLGAVLYLMQFDWRKT